MTGKFIVIEGLEGAGKSTAIKQVIKTLADHGVDNPASTREPGGTPLAEKMRELFKNGHPDDPLTDMAELLLLYAARSQLVENVIKPALAEGRWVVGDRHDMSSQAYQGAGRGFDRTVMATMRDTVLGDFRPELTIYMDIEPLLGLERARGRGELDRIEKMNIDFFNRVRTRFLEMAENNPNVIIIDANQPLEAVTADITRALTTWLEKQ